MQSSMPSINTPIWKIDPLNPQPEALALAAEVVQGGGVIVYPTETLYGLGADPMQERAVERVFLVKGRGFGKPLPLIAASLEDAMGVAANWSRVAKRLAKAFWPGPLTMVLAASDRVHPALHAGTGKVALRISSHPAAHGLCRACGGLLISTSANISAHPPFEDPDILPATFLAAIDGVLHAGRLPAQLPSTIVDLTSRPVRRLRAGAIPWEAIERMLVDESPDPGQEDMIP